MRNSIRLFLIVSLMSTPAFAATLFVPDDFQNIQEAVDSSAPGDVIEVGPGHFAGAIINHQVTIVGSAGTVIDQGNVLYVDDAFSIIGPDASGTEIRGMKFDGLPFGVFAAEADDITVMGNVFDGALFGVFGWRTIDVTVSDNVFVDAFNPIRNSGGSRWIIENNTIDRMVPISAGSFENPRNAIVLLATPGAPTNDNDIRKNWIRHVGTRAPEFPLETYTGVLLIGFGTAELTGNLVEKNYIEISVTDLQDDDISAGVALVFLDGSGEGVVENMILKNKLCGPRTPVDVVPDDLRVSNLIEKNKIKCDYDDD